MDSPSAPSALNENQGGAPATVLSRDETLYWQAQSFVMNYDAIVMTDLEGCILEWNPAAERIFGFTREEALGKTTNQVHFPKDETSLTRQIVDGVTREGLWTGEFAYICKDGSRGICELTARPMLDSQGQLIGAFGVNRDVTERKRLEAEREQALAEVLAARAQLQVVLDVLPVAVGITDAEGTGIILNPAFRALWGYAASVPGTLFENKEYKGWWARSGAPVAPEEWAMTRALLTGEVVHDDEVDIETFDGQRKTILNRAAPIRSESGTIVGAVVAELDITEHRRLERRTREALNALLCMAESLVALPDYTPTSSDLSASAETVISTGEELIAERLALLTCGVLDCKRVGITAVEAETENLRAVAVVGLTPEQEPRWWAEQHELESRGARLGDGADPNQLARFRAGEIFVLDMTQPPFSEQPNPYGITTNLVAPMRAGDRLVGILSLDYGGPPHTFTDDERALAGAVAQLGAVALEREHLLREREAARSDALALAEANRRMDEFLGIAGHELRTPLTTIKANLQFAERRATLAVQAADKLRHNGQQNALASAEEIRTAITQLQRLLDRATKSAERQERLVHDLLDVSRISAGRMEYRMALLDMAALTRDAVEEQRTSAPSRRIELALPAKARLEVYGDADRLRQVLTNYLTNALKYSEADSPVSVIAKVMDGLARLEVQDQGPGLSTEHQSQIFERFQRIPGIEVVSGSGIGLGLGLYISRTIVEQHGGQVGVDSTPGVGSTFWFTLPLLEQSGPV